MPDVMARSSPYPGLRPFEETDADFFFGQEEQQEALLGRLSNTRFVSVIGASGCGKSSLVRAGLIPHFRKQRERGEARWAIALTHPGGSPVRQLAKAFRPLEPTNRQSVESIEHMLRRHTLGILDFLRNSQFAPGRRLLIFVDQFEELFRFRRDRPLDVDAALDESALYVKLLLEAAHEPRSPVYIVTTMRSEYLEDCSEFYELSEAMNKGVFLLPRMTRLQCEEAIISPAEAKDITLEPVLIQRLLNETEERTDGLPLLQHALRFIWGKWHKSEPSTNALGLEHFEIREGNQSAPMVNRLLDVHLDEIYGELKEDQTVAEICFKLLSEWDAKGRETRRPCTAQEMMDVTGRDLSTIERVTAAFRNEAKGRTFLRIMDEENRPNSDEDRSVTGHDILDMSHECLMRQWSRLREWMKEEYRNASTLQDLARESETREPLSDFATKRYVRWRDKFRPTDHWARRYANAVHPVTGRQQISLTTALRFLAENEQSQQARRRAKVWQISGMAALLLIGLAVVITEGQSRQKALALADQRKVFAEEQAKVAQRESHLRQDSDLQKQKAEKAQAQAQTDEKAARMAVINEARAKTQAELGRAAAVSSEAKAVEEAKRADRQTQRANEQTQLATNQRLIAEEKTILADNATKQTQRVLDQRTAHTLVESAWRRADVNQTDDALAYLARALALDPDSRESAAWIFDLLLRKSPHRLSPPFVHNPIRPLPTQRLTSAAFGPLDDRMVTASRNTAAQIWNVDGTASGHPLSHSDTVNFAEFSPDGKYIATASADYTAGIWNINGQQVATFQHKGPVLSSTFSHDSRRVVTASWDQTAVIRDLETSNTIVLQHPAPVNFAAFSSDGKLVVTACYDGIVRVWNAISGQPAGTPLLYHAAKVRSARFNPRGTRIVTASSDNTAIVWDWETGIPMGETLRHKGAVNSAAFSPDGEWVVTASDDKTARVWDANSGMPMGEPLIHNDRVSSAVFSNDGKRVLTAAYDGAAAIWDVRYDFDPKDRALLGDLAKAVSGFELLSDNTTLRRLEDKEKRLQDLRQLTMNPRPSTTAWFVEWFLSNQR